ncbi:retropepsin-like aspartic protease [Asticcacaulis taihuensis]|uniref:Aspartyl protease n=1 Tax=Asticcacaulis taihuensis TaxID=260084 RepID=A0A1G4T2D4_9CAUL|nr:retropepsin-like aspartic protease [Asticcacaulis taihuensis]SCW75446.1 Aspartyl protease [Asticcacaulis taihuensis]
MPDPFSRRTFTTGGLALAASLLPGSPGWTQTITANVSQQKPEADQDSASLAARTDVNQHLTIEVSINGMGPYRFVVDTGAERSVIAENVATALGLLQGGSVILEGIGGRVRVPTVHVDTLSFGPFRRDGLNLPILPRSNLFADGYLGLDAINGTRVTFDFGRRVLNIEQPLGHLSAEGADEANVRARGNNGRLRVFDCMVNSVGAIAFIDTGAEVSVGSQALYNKLISRNHSLESFANVVLTGVTGGTITGELIHIYRIRMRDLSFTDGTLVIADVPDFSIWKIKEDRPALLIGMDYLRQFASVSIDYRYKEILFELSEAPPRPTPGVEIDHTV